MSNEEFIRVLKKRRKTYGVTQKELEEKGGYFQDYISRIENGQSLSTLNDELKEEILTVLETFNPDFQLTMLFDYVRIRCPTNDIDWVAKNLMMMKLDYFVHEDYGFYSYDEQYILGDITLMVSASEQMGTLIELKGKGCRQFENVLEAQKRTWFEFLRDCYRADCKFKRIDLAINDWVGMLDIPHFIKKCEYGEWVSFFNSFKVVRSGEKKNSYEKEEMGDTLYLGSMKSDIYFCVYEKDYEQSIKLGVERSEVDIKNRFEIRLKNERALFAIEDMLATHDVEDTCFSIINRYLRFIDKERTDKKGNYLLDSKWEWFIGDNRNQLKLTTQPEPYTLERSEQWLSKQVAPTLKMFLTLDEKKQTKVVENMLEHAKMSEKQKKIIKQQLVNIDDVIDRKEVK
ncbi:phage replication initiation protein [Lachnospiraceae bacterium PH1-22]